MAVTATSNWKTKRMKFGVYVPWLAETNPSGASFEQATLRELASLNRRHEVFVFTHSDLNAVQGKHPDVHYVRIGDYAIGRTKRAAYTLLYHTCAMFLRMRRSGRVELFRRYFKRQIETTPLNAALIANGIRLFWQTFSSETVDIPYIYGVLDCNHWVHSYQPEFAPSAGDWWNRSEELTRVIRQAAFVVASTHVLKDEITQIHGVHPSKIRVIPFFTPEIEAAELAGSVSQELANVESGRYLFYPARLMSQKNHVTVLRALKVLKAKYDLEPMLILVGKDVGNGPHVFRCITDLGLENQVKHLGMVSFATLVHLYKNAFALTYASLNGPDNFPPLEAFSLGCPVIASNLSGAREQLGDCALLFHPTNAEELADQIYNLYSDEALRARLISAGGRRAASWTARDYVTSVLRIVDEFDHVCGAWDPDFEAIASSWRQ